MMIELKNGGLWNPANEHHQMLPWYVREHISKTSILSFEAAKEVLLSAEKTVIENR